jgi:hypothetical protein
MNLLGIHLYPNLLEESWRELERERQLQWKIKEARAASRTARPSRFASLAARVRRTLQPNPCPQVAEGC